MESYIERFLNAEGEELNQEIIREGLNHYAKMVKDLWNGVPQKDKPLLLFSMEKVAAAIRNAWPEDGAMADSLGEIFSSTIIGVSAPRKEKKE